MRNSKLVIYAVPAAFVLVGLVPMVEAAAHHVHIQGFAFSPNSLTINVGDTVTWDNHDAAPHTATDNNCPNAGGPGPCEWDSGALGQGGSFSHTFNVGGTFPYRCNIHGFQGTLTVFDPNALPDLSVSALTFVDSVLSKQVRATVANGGTGSAPASQLRAEYDYQGGRLTIGTVNVPTVPAGGSRLVTLNWNTATKLGDFTVHAIADSQGVVTELNEANNERAAATSVLLPPGTLPGIDLADPI